jgi:hypothetical protein
VSEQERHGWVLKTNSKVMKSPNRDLLVLLKDDSMSDHAIEKEVERLNALLFTVEKGDHSWNAYELIDLNRFKIQHDKKSLVMALRQKELKPFLFLNNLN